MCFIDYSATHWPVRKLLNKACLKGLQLLLCIDNWYTSIETLIYCSDLNIQCVGTVKTNRKGLPVDGPIKRAPQGTIRAYRANFRDTQLYFTSWMDNKPVNMLSTYPTQWAYVKRAKKNARGAAYETVNYKRPTIIGDYNKGMGGTDLMDQFTSYYVNHTRAGKWQIRLFNHFLMVTCVNAYILWKDHTKPEKDEGVLHFIDILTTELVQQAAPEPVEEAVPVVVDPPARPVRHRCVERIVPREINGDGEYKRKARLKCRAIRDGKICNKNTNFKCSVCDVGVCAERDDEEEEETCFYAMHHCLK